MKPPARPIRVEGNLAYIPLTKGYEAVIDAADVPLVAGWNWYAHPTKHAVYVLRKAPRDGRQQKTVMLHRVLMHAPGWLYVDHINCCGLDNRRQNLRLSTNAENQQNQRRRADNTSGFKGVCWSVARKAWQAQIRVGGRKMFLGYFPSPEAAHATYVAAAVKHYSSFARAA